MGTSVDSGSGTLYTWSHPRLVSLGGGRGSQGCRKFPLSGPAQDVSVLLCQKLPSSRPATTSDGRSRYLGTRTEGLRSWRREVGAPVSGRRLKHPGTTRVNLLPRILDEAPQYPYSLRGRVAHRDSYTHRKRETGTRTHDSPHTGRGTGKTGCRRWGWMPLSVGQGNPSSTGTRT